MISVFSSSRISTSGDIHTLNRASPERAACGLPAEIPDHVADELRRHVVLHADETPVAMLKPKHLRDGKTHKAYIWSYCTTSANPTKAVVFEFSETRAGENVRVEDGRILVDVVFDEEVARIHDVTLIGGHGKP